MSLNKNRMVKKKDTDKKSVKYLVYFWKVIWCLIRWPDFASLWYFKAKKKLKTLLKVNHYNIIVSVSLPISSHFLGYYAKSLRRDVVWIMDIGDPFFLLSNKNSKCYNPIYRCLGRYLEKKCFIDSQAIFVTNQSIKTAYEQCVPSISSKIFLTYPLISEELVQKLIKNNRKPMTSSDEVVRAFFFGTLYPGLRSPDFLLSLFGNLFKRLSEKRLELHFFGNYKDCLASFSQYNPFLNQIIFLHDFLDREAMFDKLIEADVLVNIGNLSKLQVPSKLVEYMAAGKPVLNIASIEGDSSLNFMRSNNYPNFINVCSKWSEINYEGLIDFIINAKTLDHSSCKKVIEKFCVQSIANTYKKVCCDIR